MDEPDNSIHNFTLKFPNIGTVFGIDCAINIPCVEIGVISSLGVSGLSTQPGVAVVAEGL